MIYSVLNCFQVYSRSIGSDFFLVWGVNRFNSISVSENSGNIFSEESKQKLSEAMKKIGRDTGDRELLNAVNTRPDMNLCATPFLYSVFAPFSQMTFSHARTFFFGMGVLALLTGFVFLGFIRKVPFSLTLLFLGSIFIFYYPVEMSLSLGNVNEIIILISILFYGIPKLKSSTFQKVLEGFFIGLMCLLKPFFIYSVVMLFVFFFLHNRRLSGFYVLGLCFSLAVGLGISSVCFDLFSSWAGWMRYLNILDIEYWSKSVIYGNFSLRAVLFHAIGYDPFIFQYLCGIMAVFIPVLLNKYCKKDPRDQVYYLFWSGYILFLLNSPLVWYHYFSLLVVPFYCVLSEADFQPRQGQFFFSLIMGLIWVLIGMPYCYENCWAPGPLTKALLFYLSMLILMLFWTERLFSRCSPSIPNGKSSES